MSFKTDRLTSLFPGVYGARNREAVLYKLLDAAGAELVEADEPDVIVVRDKARTKVYFLGFTDRIERPRNLQRGSAVTLGEPRRGEPAPIVAFYPLQSARGHRFIYTR